MKPIQFTVTVIFLMLGFFLLGTVSVQAADDYIGIGVTIKPQHGWLVIDKLAEDSPAAKAGLRRNDVVMAIDGQAVAESDWLTASNQLWGQAGVTVTLTVSRSVSNQIFTVPMTHTPLNIGTTVWSCRQDPIRGFGKVWQEQKEVRQRLGCAFTDQRAGEHATASAVQTFEHGWMLWLETDTVAMADPIYVFYDDDGSYTRLGDRPLADAHQYSVTEAGFYKVGDRFAKVYGEELGVMGRLGRATSEAVDSPGAFQEFEQGRMFWSKQADTIYVIYHAYYDLDGDGKEVYQQGWLAFNDIFEDVESKQ